MNTKKEMKKNRVVTYPSGTFTVDELVKINSNFIPITLRSRLTKAIDQGVVTKIGTIPRNMGRPQMLLAKTPVTDEHIIEARNKNVIFNSELNIQVKNLENTSVDNTDTHEEIIEHEVMEHEVMEDDMIEV